MRKHEADSKASTRIDSLRWAARLVSLLPGLGLTGLVALVVLLEATEPFPMGVYWPWGGSAPTALVIFSLFAIPGVVAWKWHKAGGVWLLAQCAIIIVLINLYSGHHRYDVLHVVLPLGLPALSGMFIGGCLHLLVAFRDSAKHKRVPRQGSSEHASRITL